MADPDRLVHLFHLVLQAMATANRESEPTLRVRSFSHHGHIQVSIRSREDSLAPADSPAESQRPLETRRGLGLFVADYLARELGGRIERGRANATDILMPL
jgi:C4-dicarboxylate-specific signal transduction histidine kinase